MISGKTKMNVKQANSINFTKNLPKNSKKWINPFSKIPKINNLNKGILDFKAINLSTNLNLVQ
jgi:hypothetical protein